MKTDLYRHQEDAIAKLRGQAFGAILFECGLGKTRTALELCAREGFRRVLVLCPLSVRGSWVEEIEKMRLAIKVQVVEGIPAKKKALLKEAATVTLLSYDSVPTLLEELKKEAWDCLIMDESTKVKAFRTLRTRSILKLSRGIPHRYILTGTPVTERVQDIWSQFFLLSPHILGTSFVAFRSQYCELGGFKGKQIVGAKNVPHLVDRIAPYSCRATKAECLDLPEKIYETRTAPLTPEQKKIIKKLREAAKVTDYATGAGLLTTVQRVCGGYDVIGNRPLEENPKLDMLGEVLDETSLPVIVWCRFLEDVKAVERYLVKRGIPTRVMTGDTMPGARDVVVSDFMGGKAQALVATNVGGYGINLQGSCTTVIFYSHWWSYEARSQAEDRVHRIGTVKPVTYVDLLMQRSVDRQIYRSLSKKEDFAEFIMKHLEEALAEEGES